MDNKELLNKIINIIETYEVPIGNSPAGELACDWTFDALRKIRDQIKEEFKDIL